MLRERVEKGRRVHPCGIDAKEIKQPHRLAKRKVKFTGKKGSMKKAKQKAARVERRKAREAVKRGDEPVPGSRWHVRWDVW